ncbi:hypothetical protein [Aeromonas hydrophila]|uniref:hypothetical protein n=1 Tax=Aeromonas hydrophila TaxID=644 RepID=UPI000AF0C321|nr:hypothetical protein [Aeromonas hydrophila]
MTQHFIIGDHLVTPHPEGQHHGIFVGHDQVIHCLPTPAGEPSGQLALTSLTAFSQHGVIEVKPHAQRLFSREETLTRAYARLNEGEQGQAFAVASNLLPGASKDLPVPPSCCRPQLQPSWQPKWRAIRWGKRPPVQPQDLLPARWPRLLAGVVPRDGRSITGIASAPLLAPLAVGAVAAYGISKLWDWFND